MDPTSGLLEDLNSRLLRVHSLLGDASGPASIESRIRAVETGCSRLDKDPFARFFNQCMCVCVIVIGLI